MNCSCHYFINRLGMPMQFCDSNPPVSALHDTNLYSLISSVYFHWPSLSVSWQRIYNIFAVDKSSITQKVFTGRLLILLLIYDDSILQFTLQSDLNPSYRLSLYRHGRDHAENAVSIVESRSWWGTM
jgi:hypothetical protein